MKLVPIVTLLSAALASAACGDNLQAEDPCRDPESGIACRWAGLSAGQEGFNGDGLHRLDTEIYWSMDMLWASDGTAWFLDWNNHLVRRVLADDTVETVVGWTDPVFPGDGVPGQAAAERSEDGALGTDVRLNHPTDFAELPDGSILVMAWHNHKLRRVDPETGLVKIMCGSGAGFVGDGGPAAGALFKQPKSLVVDEDGNIYIGDQQNFRVRKIDVEGTISTVVGNGTQAFAGDGGPATEASLNWEAGDNPEPSGGLAVADGTLYVSDTLNHRIRAVDLASGTIETIAGTGGQGNTGDGGPATEASLNGPRDIEVGPDGHLYVADTDNSVVRAIDLQTGVIRRVAGRDEPGLDAEDGLPAVETALHRPFGVEFDHQGNLFVMDTLNSRILKVTR
jgi:outer membrane protein assembly factor BamB